MFQSTIKLNKKAIHVSSAGAGFACQADTRQTAIATTASREGTHHLAV